jgi:hypothetical protein
MVEPLRHRQTKGAATAMFYLMPPRHISTLHIASFRCGTEFGRYRSIADIGQARTPKCKSGSDLATPSVPGYRNFPMTGVPIYVLVGAPILSGTSAILTFTEALGVTVVSLAISDLASPTPFGANRPSNAQRHQSGI